MADNMEGEASKCNSLRFREALLDSISCIKDLLTDIARRIGLQGQKISRFAAVDYEFVFRILERGQNECQGPPVVLG